MSVSRRGFLGGIIATSALPTIAADSASSSADFAKRGPYERMTLNYQRVQIGLEKPFSVLHISDTHLTACDARDCQQKREFAAYRTQIFGGRQLEALADSLAWARQNVDYVVHTGDLIDFQSAANFDLVRKYFGANMFGTVGNHEFEGRQPNEAIERTEAANARKRPILEKAFPFPVQFSAKTVNGVNFVSLEQVYGTVSAKQVDLFAAEVKKGLPIVLLMHVPFFDEDSILATDKYWRRPDAPVHKFTNARPNAPADYQRQCADKTTVEFIRYLKGEKLLRAILCGHQHFAMQTRFSPTAMQFMVGANFMPNGEEILFT